MFLWPTFANKTWASMGSQYSFKHAIAKTLAAVLPFALLGCSNITDNQTTDTLPASSPGAATVEIVPHEKPPVALHETTESKGEPKEELEKVSPVPQTLSAFQIPADWSDGERKLMTSMQRWDGQSELNAEGTDPARIIRQLDTFAQHGDLEASFLLGALHTKGWVVSADQDKAAEYLAPTFKNSHRGAIHFAATNFYFTTPDAAERQKLFEVLQKNADAGFIPSQVTIASILSLGFMREKDPTEATRWALRALRSEPENNEAMTFIFLSFRDASLEKEEGSEIFKLFEERANAGSPEAMHFIGECCAEGAGTEKDLTKATEWYQRAMDKEFPAAFGSMGNLIQKESGKNWQDQKITMEQHRKNILLCRTLWKHGAELGDGFCEIMLSLTARLVKDHTTEDYSAEAMMNRAYNDALLDAAGLEQIGR